MRAIVRITEALESATTSLTSAQFAAAVDVLEHTLEKICVVVVRTERPGDDDIPIFLMDLTISRRTHSSAVFSHPSHMFGLCFVFGSEDVRC